MTWSTQVVVIGGGQAGLAAGYHLRRLGIEFVILDSRSTPGGAWQRTWESPHLFFPAAFSSLPGWLMPTQAGEEYPDATWVTQRPPRFLADDIDGRALFDAATARRRALDEGGTDTGGVALLGDIVAVPPVRTARDGVQASARRSPTSPHSSCGKRVAAASPSAPRPWPNHACICSATATGPGRPPPR